MFEYCQVLPRRKAFIAATFALAFPAALGGLAVYGFEAKGDLDIDASKPIQSTPQMAPHGTLKEPVVAPKSEVVDAQTNSVMNEALSSTDYKVVFAKAEELRNLGKTKPSITLYLKATSLEPSLWMAYHQLSTMDLSQEQMKEALDRLELLKVKLPKELMLRVALSELLEKKGDYYQASRELVDLVYANSVPEKYSKRVNARIHYLLSKSKHAYSNEQGGEFENLRAEEELDTVPPPLPDQGLVIRDLASTKAKDMPPVQGAGHTPLQP